jgi:heme oxygenase
MSLRDLTKEAHTNAERQEFVKILFSGEIDPKLYALFLKNIHPQYEILEVCAMATGVMSGMPDVRRAPSINSDFEELWDRDRDGEPKILPVVKDYIDHIMSIKSDPQKLMAHLYVRHMGDLAGGQMIAKKIPGSGRMYQFSDPEGLKTAIRAKISDDMAEEANICFEFATRTFKEIMDLEEFKK